MNNFPVIFHYDEPLDCSFYGRDLIFEKGSFSGPKTVPIVAYGQYDNPEYLVGKADVVYLDNAFVCYVHFYDTPMGECAAGNAELKYLIFTPYANAVIRENTVNYATLKETDRIKKAHLVCLEVFLR